MLQKKLSTQIVSNDNIYDIKFLVTSQDKINHQISKEPQEIPKKEKIKRNKSINSKYIFIQNLQQLCSNSTPKKKKSLYKKGKSVKFRVISDQCPVNIQEEYEINNETTTNFANFLEQMLTKSHSKRKISKKNMIHLKVPNKLRKEINNIKIDIVYPV